MYRRTLSVILVPCLLLTQSAALGHTHNGSEPAGHDLRPHFHLTTALAGHTHDDTHHHSHHGDHHHNDGNQTKPPLPLTPDTSPLSSHDNDAVFIEVVDALVHGRSAIADAGADWSQWIALGLATVSSISLSDISAAPAHPPPRLTSSSCPLYVRHLTLLI